MNKNKHTNGDSKIVVEEVDILLLRAALFVKGKKITNLTELKEELEKLQNIEK